jgi:hypothetical protein
MPDTLVSLLYVSEATHSLPGGGDPVEAIVEVALSRNAALDVTGALIFTGNHFAQVLEGPPAAVAELMVSISRDERHGHVDVVETASIAERRFPDWSLAYAGPSVFVDRHIAPLLQGPTGREASDRAARLIRLMREFATGPAFSR